MTANDIINSWRHFGWISRKNINYLLWGLLGTNIGSTPPTTPKIAVKRITGKSANPMMTLYDLYPSKFSQSAKLWYPEPKFRCGYWDPSMKLYLYCSRANSKLINSLLMLQNDLPTSFQKRRLWSYLLSYCSKTSCSPNAVWQNIDHMSRVLSPIFKYVICFRALHRISIYINITNCLCVCVFVT